MADKKQTQDIQVTLDEAKAKIWSHIRQKWLVETPEERVRQEYLPVLVGEYAFALEQIDEELEITGRGSGHARADFVICRTVEDRQADKPPLITSTRFEQATLARNPMSSRTCRQA